MRSFGHLIDETLGDLHGLGRVSIESTHLTDAVDGETVEFPIEHPSRLSEGIAEVGQELVWIDKVDTDNQKIVLAPYGRGFQGTVAEPHDGLVRIQSNPRWPRGRVAEAINSTIRQVAGSLFVPGSEVFTTDTTGVYVLDSDVRDVLQVRVKHGSVWEPFEHWEFVTTGDPNLSSGKAIQLPVGAGVEVEVITKLDPLVLTGEDDEFAQVTGLPESCWDVIKLGTQWRLLAGVDMGRLDTETISAAQLDGQQQAGIATTLSGQMFTMFQQRVREENQKLVNQFGGSIRRGR